MISVEQVRRVAMSLPRTTEGLVADHIKFRVGRIVYVSISRDETRMGFGFPKEQRAGLVAGEPEKFLMPRASDLRYNWAVVRLDRIEEVELAELVLDAWCIVVSKKAAAQYLARLGPDWSHSFTGPPRT